MFPLKAKYRIGYRFKEPTSYSKYHLGLDCICPLGTAVYAPFDGKVTTTVGTQGGNTVWFYYQDVIMRMMHLSRFNKTGEVKEGDIIGYVGSTGTLSTGSHLHLDISKNSVQINNIDNFIDPESFDWGLQKEDFMTDQKLHDMLRDHVDMTYRTYFHRVPSEDEINGHVEYIKRASGDSYNFSGLRQWDEQIANSDEFKSNWEDKKKCEETISQMQVDYKKEVERITKLNADKIFPAECPVKEKNGEPMPSATGDLLSRLISNISDWLSRNK